MERNFVISQSNVIGDEWIWIDWISFDNFEVISNWNSWNEFLLDEMGVWINNDWVAVNNDVVISDDGSDWDVVDVDDVVGVGLLTDAV